MIFEICRLYCYTKSCVYFYQYNSYSIQIQQIEFNDITKKIGRYGAEGFQLKILTMRFREYFCSVVNLNSHQKCLIRLSRTKIIKKYR